MPSWGRSRESDVVSVIFPKSGELLSNSGELFRRRRSSLAEVSQLDLYEFLHLSRHDGALPGDAIFAR
jgi:hypothetical protein